ncbi:GHMP kinase [Bradyrhizobium sp. Ash2021]|uniref:GHMP family kinase ATP-binding protein n=1 Tax=Bradyrhizobium sp. Ash2021 TaxID=2954771 RepID=UPI0028151254|nr:GHMP kinase [Bradyrhizobium sp. Ash2021]WMT72956.1 GHMP kinase [Bradyrhizobium sp. Ash2021]
MLVPSLPLTGVRSRAPLRLGLAGGGTDVSPYPEQYGGAVLNATINRYAFAFIEPSPDWKVRFIATDLEVEETFALDLEAISTARLKLHAAVYSRMVREFAGGCPLAITVRTLVDAPAGSGLGSSSALVVALVEAFRAVLDLPLGAYEIAHLAFEVERIDLGLAGGKQDQYAAAFGGINFIEFMADNKVIVNPLRISRATLNELETSLITCFSGISRQSDEIIEHQKQGILNKSAKTLESLHLLKGDAIEMKRALLLADIPAMALILNRSWAAKKETSSAVTNQRIDELNARALETGALAGKVSGAGGGGFIMFIVPPERRFNIIRSLNDTGAAASPVQFTSVGAESWVVPTASPMSSQSASAGRGRPFNAATSNLR